VVPRAERGCVIAERPKAGTRGGVGGPRRGITRVAIAVAVLLCSFAVNCPVNGQTQAPQSPPAKSESQAAKKRKLGPLEISGNWRLRVEGWDWFESGSGNGNYAYAHSLLRVALGQEGSRFDWKFEAAQVTLLGLPTNAAAAAPQGQLGLGGSYFAANGSGRNVANGFVKQAYVMFRGLGRGSLRVGRFEFLDGAEAPPKDATLAALVQTRVAQRLIGNFGWAAAQRSYDGAQFAYNFGKNNFTFVGGRPTRGVYQADGWGELDVDLFYGALTVPVEAKHGAGRLRAFGLGYIDHRTGVLRTDNRPQAVRAADHGQIRIGTYGADYLHVFNTAMRGKINILLWGALQSGTWGNQTHRAGAFVGELGWQPPVKTLKPWLSAGYSFGSGDINAADGRHSTFFQVLPTPRPYARFPFYNMMNNEDFYGALSLRPHAKLGLRTELHALRLSQAGDLWYLGGGAFQQHTFGYTGRPSGGNRSLANVWDVSADFQATHSFGLGFYYAHAWGKGVIAGIYPGDRNGQFAYVETNVRF
jgi:hypothetical protein